MCYANDVDGAGKAKMFLWPKTSDEVRQYSFPITRKISNPNQKIQPFSKLKFQQEKKEETSQKI